MVETSFSLMQEWRPRAGPIAIVGCGGWGRREIRRVKRMIWNFEENDYQVLKFVSKGDS